MNKIHQMDLWTKPMRVHGVTVTPKQMQRAWRYWSRFPGIHPTHRLVGCLGVEGVPYTGFVASETTNRMLQRARKAGVIHYVGGRWELVPDTRAT